MKTSIRATIAALASSVILLGAAAAANAQERSFFQAPKPGAAKDRANTEGPEAPILGCNGPITKVLDIAYEGFKSTSAVFGSNPGGGEGTTPGHGPSPCGVAAKAGSSTRRRC